MHTHVHTHTHTQMHAHMHTHMDMHPPHMHTHTWMHIHNTHTQTHIHMHIHTHTHTHTPTCTPTHGHAHPHTPTHTHKLTGCSRLVPWLYGSSTSERSTLLYLGFSSNSIDPVLVYWNSAPPVHFSSRWYLCAQKSPHALHPHLSASRRHSLY